jgi:ABC-type transport system involved in multi-copper enzyme maturation permease subunit
MKAIRLIAFNTYIEIIRNRILVGIVVFAVLMIGFSLLLGQLSFAEQARISMDFGLSSIQFAAVVLSIFVGSTLVSREIEKQTILTLLVKPISRFQFLLGKAAGLVLVNLVTVGGLAAVLSVVLYFLNVPLHLSFLVGLAGILMESLVILGVTLFFSTFSTPFMVVAFSVGIWLIGNWMESLKHFSSKSQDSSLIWFGKVLEAILPNLEQFNWKTAAVYADSLPVKDVSLALANAICWFIFFVLAASLIFRRRDFV